LDHGGHSHKTSSPPIVNFAMITSVVVIMAAIHTSIIPVDLGVDMALAMTMVKVINILTLQKH
jgi:hypothetical protein